ncbi:hypothetical protein GZ77_00030 [Endozoicomonas montiporae]|uniref:Uncharacterized protein n=2 Tax=Endozoicomonas montiporae TaxID=1027273 RepID=A0A081N9L3_9GAMM|nr:hypothetical protein [Endozoicomonas montiporae]AMO54985.1 hypothetical protein EZMO1_0758 [Endozoicomonas montiporae CL-33]KEQ15136.1 hypothetical protein GZ77_00030 [Endozoicomonas montiporae]
MSATAWFIVTNTENLEFFLNCGLIVDKNGFPKSAYVNDAMCDTPDGYLPCYPQSNLLGALQVAKSEDENLSECLLELDIKQITASAFYRTEELEKGAYHPFNIEGNIDDSQTFSEVLLPAPLPLSCIKNIILKDVGTKKSIAIKYECAYGSNSGKFVTNKAALFKGPKRAEGNLALGAESELTATKSLSEQVPNRKLNYNKAFSYGGALILLYYQTKNGRQSSQTFHDFAANNIDSEKQKNIAPLLEFFGKNDNSSETAQLYSQIIRCISDQTNVDEARYDILQLLKDEHLPAGYARDCAGIANSLTGLVERTLTDDSDTIFEKTIKHYEAKEPGRSKIFILLTMFFVRDHSETMLKYYHNRFTEEDYCLLALFFGAVNGFINVPSAIRGIQDLSTWVSFKMAEYMHEQDKSNVISFPEPSRPLMLYDKCFKSGNTNYYEKRDFYMWFSRHMDVSIDEFVNWTTMVKPRAEPKITAEIIFDSLEKFMSIKTISNASELFNFNPIIDAFKKKS